MAGYICPECGVDLSVKNEDIRAHALSHWGQELGDRLSPEAKERKEAMLAEAEKGKK